MAPTNLRFGGGPAETILSPIVLIAMILAIILIFALRRKYIVVPLLCMAFLVPLGQEIVVGGVHVMVLRIVILAGLIRLIISKQSEQGNILSGGFNSIDKIFTLWVFFHVATFLILFSFQSQALFNRFGYIWDSLGGFFLLRFLIQDQEDIKRIIKTLALIAMIQAGCMLNEHFRTQNVFGLLGGIRSVPEMRNGIVRAQGVFAHPLLAGSFGATSVPLFIWLWKDGRSKLLCIFGLIASTLIIMTTGETTSILTYAAAVGAVSFWPFRKRMRMFRWGIVFVLVAMALVMKAPIWFVIAHVDLTGSSSNYQRAALIDQFIRHFGNWWLIGTNSNASWGWDMWDQCNQFVSEGETGGLAAFICFVVLISLCFSRIGNMRKSIEGNREKEWLLWLLGASLFSHVVAFFGVAYFDQTIMLFFVLLAVTTAVTQITVRAEQAQEEGCALFAETPPQPACTRDPALMKFGTPTFQPLSHGSNAILKRVRFADRDIRR